MATQKIKKKLSRKLVDRFRTSKKKLSIRKKKVSPRFKLEFFAQPSVIFDPDQPVILYAKIYDKKRRKYIDGFWEEDHAQAIIDHYNKNTKKHIPFPYEDEV